MFSILIVDDEPDNFDVIETFLNQKNYQLHYTASGQDAIASLPILCPDLILLDVMMPGIDGIEVCRRIKSMPEWKAVPIIIITALTAKADLVRCFDSGADDFISKPINRLELQSRVRSMLRIHQQYQQLATFNTRLEAAVQERTEQLRSMLFTDRLTQLPSRAYLIDQLDRQLQGNAEGLALICLDCDEFKLVNGSFGHAIGDQLLVAIAHRLTSLLKPDDVLVRLGGDEFCFFLHQIHTVEHLDVFIQELLESFKIPFTVANCELFITACMGVALVPPHHTPSPISAEELLQAADTAMYQAKLQGKGSYQVFDQQMQHNIIQRLTLENDLQHALKQQEFVLHYQPIVRLNDCSLQGFEALLRWKHPERGMVSPGEFIPCMEASGMIVPVGLFVLEEACRQLHTWHQWGWSHLVMSINLSARQFACPTLLADVDRILEKTQVNPASVKLEITETAIMDNAAMAIALTNALRSRQIHLSIDDFGTGYSSLSYLHQFPVDSLKIDHTFVKQLLTENHRDYHVVNTIVALSQQLGLSVIAEGIETEQQLQWLKQLGCQAGQGFFFSPALAPGDIEGKYGIVPANNSPLATTNTESKTVQIQSVKAQRY
ncbi:MAG: EAL domain-containing protein [Leptolyngbyaceae bacterium]|nr:EAL domain-containing protein [Leptolyngbyaceae bacterium]